MNTNKTLIREPYLTNSRFLRKNQTPWETKLWFYLRAGKFYGLKFKRQVAIGSYIYDFVCHQKMIIIEADGGQHSEQLISAYDKTKQNFAEKAGYKVLRFWNNDIDANIEAVLSKIKDVCGV